MIEPPRSQQFDDVYFSADDGLAETRHVFVEGNGLPGRWQGRDRFTIAETGFGTGLNFLAAWKLFDETAPPGAFLDFISVEKYPLGAGEIRRGLAHWAPELGRYLDRFLEQYPLRTAGFHRMVFDGRVALTLIFDDANDALPQLEARVDAWFLDGFTPAKNPLMWTQTVFNEMARLSVPGATFATFTAAGDVKRGLRDAGFSVNKQKGFGRKRDMLAGVMPGDINALPRRVGRRVAIIGGGLAGTSCAYVLKQYGFTPVIYEKENTLAAGASGNRLGLYNPRFTALRGPESDVYASAFALAHRTFGAMKDIDFNPCGALHFMTDDDKRKRFPRTVENWGWHADHMRLVDAAEASAIAGVTLNHDALYLPDSGCVSPHKLCHAYANDVDVRLNTAADVKMLDADFIVHASGPALLGQGLPLETVRGQVSYAVADEKLRTLKTALCYGGYLAPGADGSFMLGSTFQKWLSDTDVTDGDHADNIAKLATAVPALAGIVIEGGRAALRTAAKDRFPVIGTWGGDGRTFISAAHGSHGLLSSLVAAHYIADRLRGGPLCLPGRAAASLDPRRFSQSG